MHPGGSFTKSYEAKSYSPPLKISTLVLKRCIGQKEHASQYHYQLIPTNHQLFTFQYLSGQPHSARRPLLGLAPAPLWHVCRGKHLDRGKTSEWQSPRLCGEDPGSTASSSWRHTGGGCGRHQGACLQCRRRPDPSPNLTSVPWHWTGL